MMSAGLSMANALWDGSEFVSALDGRLIKGSVPQRVDGISIDSRTIKKGEAFFALKGPNFDGHEFIDEAEKKGASVCVVSAEQQFTAPANTGQTSIIKVADPLRALTDLAIAARKRTRAKIIAITGSVGKSSTKEALHIALRPFGKVHSALASYNNHIGVPLTLANMPVAAQFAIFEIGMNAPGEIETLAGYCQPDLVIVTAIAPAHLEKLGDLKTVAAAKSEIFISRPAPSCAIINADTPYSDHLCSAARAAGIEDIMRYSLSAGGQDDASAGRPDAFLVETEQCALGSQALYDIGQKRLTVRLGATGRHQISNAMAVLLAVKHLGEDLTIAGTALGEFHPLQGRGNLMDITLAGKNIRLIDETYNANPASMEAAIAALGSISSRRQGRRIAILGEMSELGVNSAQYHRSLAEPIVQANLDGVFCLGKAMTPLWEALPEKLQAGFAGDIHALLPVLRAYFRDGDHIMLKASRSVALERLIHLLRQHEDAQPKGNPVATANERNTMKKDDNQCLSC